MKFLLVEWAIGAALSLIVVPVSAHHGFAMFDRSTEVTLEGNVARFDWKNPHVYIYLDVLDESGETVQWTFETYDPTSLTRAGWASNSIETGDRVTVSANPHRNPQRHIGFITTLITPDGTRLPPSGNAPPSVPPEVAMDLSGIWQAEFGSSFAIYRRYLYESAAAPLTPKAEEALAAVEESQNPAAACRLDLAPWVMATPGDVYELELHESQIILRDPELGLERVVNMSHRTHEATEQRTDQGDSVGWWEDDVLVVDTTHFADHRWGNGRGIPSGAQRHLVERFRLSEDRTSLTYDFVLEDPEFLSQAIDGSVRWQYAPSLLTRTPQPPCDPEVARRYLTED